jgi:hypothetical protein
LSEIAEETPRWGLNPLDTTAVHPSGKWWPYAEAHHQWATVAMALQYESTRRRFHINWVPLDELSPMAAPRSSPFGNRSQLGRSILQRY